ncbi:hypothetical protein EW145_g3369 [Phellinidium pouzarii]|uniref:DSBA-like thioredoxin domain-containing protein n=1 Tax=Phellinidium pouzarii TaxID=167371 RepID=A0A4S4L7K8_9AGAM|nr:hypothetical protein EW145_g3369 [Phellinidium pouzarii]
MSISVPTRKTIKIDVVSDFLCAWCYIGHIELEHGMALARAASLPVDFVVQYHPFILHPSLPSDIPITKQAFYERKMGADKWQQTLEIIQGRAKQEGLEFSFEGVVRQTARAHRLLQRAYAIGGQTAQQPLLKRLFRAFFEQGRDIGDARVLAELATASDAELTFAPATTPRPTASDLDPYKDADPDEGEGGADLGASADDTVFGKRLFKNRTEAQRWIEGNELDAAVRAASADAARKGVSGVPFTVIDGRWAVSGCQAPACYLKIFEKLAVPQPVNVDLSKAIPALAPDGTKVSVGLVAATAAVATS